MPPDWLLVVLDLALIVAVAQLGGALAARLGQPRIAGEMLAVVGIGPTLLGGQIAEIVPGQPGRGLVDALYPEPVLTAISLVGGLGLVLYMLLVGITIDAAPMRKRAGAIGLLGGATIASMTALAIVAGPWLADAGWKPAGVAQGAFVLAIAAGLAANGVPIVARILEERQLLHSEVGAIVIVSAAIVTALALIASAVAIGGGDASAGERVVLRIGGGLTVLALVLWLARRRRRPVPTVVAVAAVLDLAVLSALAGERLFSSALIGPLVVGVAVRTSGATARVVEQRLGAVVRRVLLPVFLGVAALHTDLRELGGGALWPALAIIAAVVVIKFAVAYPAARLARFGSGEACAIAALLQCGGIMTIAISLDVLRAGVIGQRLHATLTLVGLVSTIVAGPLLARARLGPVVGRVT